MGRIALSAVLFANPVSLFSQETTNEDDQVFELSPFEVSTSENVGYLANNTLAGTRINAQLQDIANSVQVLTQEFIDDVGATELSELLIYTTGTEAAGVNGNASFGEDAGTDLNQERSRREPHLNTRVRGLSRADLSRDYFLSDVPFDSYNTAEVTINRGPNASLFGLGSPGGIVNSEIHKASTSKTFGILNFQTDEFGSWRGTLNYNQMLIEDKLAVRVAALDSDQRFEQRQAYYDQERYFIAATWRPLKGMIIRANYETGDGTGSRPNLVPPKDNLTAWFENGKPGYDPYNNQWYIDGQLVTDTAHRNALNSASTTMFRAGLITNGAPVAIFDDPNSPLMGNNGYATIQAGFRSNAAGRTSSNYPGGGNRNLRKWASEQRNINKDPVYIWEARPEIPNGARSYYKDPVITDRDIFDFRKYNIMGAMELHENSFDVKSIRAEQTFLQNSIGVELAYQEQTYEGNLSGPTPYEITPDINLTLMDGSPNPNYGRPYTGNRGFTQAENRDRDAFQVIAFGKYDFADKHDNWLKHLGNHVLTAVYQDQERLNTAPNRMYARTDSPWGVHTATGSIANAQAAATSNKVSNATMRGLMAHYIGPSMANISSISEAEITPITALQVPYPTDNALVWDPFTGTWTKGSAEWFTYRNDPDEVWTFGNNADLETIESYSTVLQSKLLKDHIVATVSWRTDDVSLGTGIGPQDPATGLYLPVIPEITEQVTSASEEQTSYGIVAHVPDSWMPLGLGLSFHYVDSQNFAAGVTGVDTFNRPGPLQTGTTKEYGVSLSAFEGRLYARLNFYETAQENEVITGALPFPANDIKLVMENNTPAELAAAGWDLDTLFKPGYLESFDFRPQDPNVPNNETDWLYTNIAGSPTNYYQDTASEGVEFELSYAPTSNWRIALNVATAEVQVANVMKISRPELERIANEIFSDPVMGQLWITEDREAAMNSINPNEGRLITRADNLLAGVASKTAAEGGPLPEIVKLRWNLVTNYTFGKNSPLSGFTVGAGARWQDAPYIGSDVKQIEDGSYVPDYDKKYYGDTEFDIDAWLTYSFAVWNDMDLRLQLRVRNLNKGDGELIPIRADPDGVVRIYRIGAPRYFELSAQLKF